jgi:hypothetical protein
MAGLVTTTFYPKGKTWMPGTGPGMTKNRMAAIFAFFRAK